MRVLISRLSALGDVVCSLPAAVALKRTFADCHITWAVDPRFAGIVECCGSVDSIVRYKPATNWRSIPTYPERFDVALDLQGLLKSALGIARAKATVKLGYHWQREGSRLFSAAVKPDPSSFHVVDQYVDVARAAGAVVDRAEFDLKPAADDLESICMKLADAGITGRFAIANAGAGWATKRWPATSFAALSHELSTIGLPLVLVGGKAPADHDVGAEVLAAGGIFTSLIGETNVRQLVAAISLAAVHIGGDTGTTHIAAALGIPAVGLYSITKPIRSCPYGQIDRCLYDPTGLANIQCADVAKMVLESAR